jgi:hypothetical protein
LEAIAHTLADDAAIMGDRSLPTGLIASVTAPALVISGEQSPPFLRAAARAVAQALPNGRLASLPGQGHDISPEATAPVMAELLASRASPPLWLAPGAGLPIRSGGRRLADGCHGGSALIRQHGGVEGLSCQWCFRYLG